MDVIPGLRNEIQRTLSGLYQTAVELGRMHPGAHSADDRFMQIRIGDYRVSYVLDVDRAMARVMFVEPLESIPPTRQSA